jgi:predicted ester cyclase
MGQASKELQLRFIDEFQSKGDVAVAEEILTDDFVDHTPFGPIPGTREGVIQLFGMLRAAFPDLRAEVHDLLVDGDKVVTRKTFHGTHQGDFMGIAPTGNSVAWDVIDIVRHRDGRFVEHWNVVDAYGLMAQLGAIPS